MTRDEFRRMALAYPEAVETADDGVPHFRVRGKAFARLTSRDLRWADVMIPRKDAEAAAAGEPELFSPLPHGWFRTGFTQINLAKAGAHTVRSALNAAWRLAAPKSLAAGS
jgi:hypothetical protein